MGEFHSRSSVGLTGDPDESLRESQDDVRKLERLHPLEHLIVLSVHPQSCVHLLRARVAAIDVETDTAQ